MERVLVSAESLTALVEALFREAGVSPADAATIARVQLDADLRGMHSHGMRAVPTYLERIRTGVINPTPTIRVDDLGAVAAVNGDDGPGQVVAVRAMEECIARARKYHVGMVTVRRSNHLGAAGYYVGMAAAADLIGIATTNGNLVLAPPDSLTPTVGNNPIAIGAPADEEPDFVLDVAMSVVAGGKVDLAAAEGDELPEGWCFDAAGKPTRELSAALAGLGIPLGAPTAGHKGFGLALGMEILAGALSGAAFGRQHTAEVEDGPRPWDEGHFFLAIDPAITMPLADFKARVDRLIREVRSTRPAPGGQPAHAPGERAAARRERALREGIWMPGSIVRRLNECAAAAGLSYHALAASPPGEFGSIEGEGSTMPTSSQHVSFEADVKPLFRESDRGAMKFAFDLWSYGDVKSHAEAILENLVSGSMPCDEAWPAEKISVFRRWVESGTPE